MNRLIAISLFFMNYGIAFSQFSTLKWVTPYYQLDFTKTPPKLTTYSNNFIGDNKVFAFTDCNGQFKFVASLRGFFLNSTLDTIPGGSYLPSGRNSYAGSLDGIVYPGSKDSVIVFHTIGKYPNLGFGWSLIDLSANGGVGKVRNLSVPLGNYTSANMTIIRHTNNRDFWVLSTPDSVTLNAHLLTSNGISNTVVSSKGHFCSPTYYSVNFFVPGELTASRDGRALIVSGLRKEYHPTAVALKYDFDASTGKITNEQIIVERSSMLTPEHMISRITFSPNDSLFYYGTSIYFSSFPSPNGTWELYQQDRYNNKRIQIAKITDYRKDASYKGISKTVLAPNNRIMCSLLNQGWSVRYPNNRGSACNFLKDPTIGGRWHHDAYSPITWPYYTASNQINECTDTTTFYMGGDTGVYKMVLRFGDGDTLLYTGKWHENLKFKHYYKQNGKYPVTMITWSNYCNSPRTLVDTMEVLKPPVYAYRNLERKPTCAGDSLIVKLYGQNQNWYSVNWGVNKPGGGQVDSIVKNSIDTAVFRYFYNRDSLQTMSLTTSIKNTNCPITQIDSIKVQGLLLPKPKISLSKSSLCAGEELTLLDSTTDRTRTNIYWVNGSDTIIGIGHKDKTIKLPNAFKDSVYAIYVNVFNSNSCMSKDTLHYLIKAAPLAVLGILDSVVCAKQQKLEVRVRSSQNPKGTQWTINDGNFTHYDTNFTQTYTNPMSSRILAIGTYNGCQWTDSLPFRVTGLPNSDFIISEDTVCFANHKLRVNNAAISNYEPIDSLWYNMGNGSVIKTIDVLNYTYSNFGTYVIKQKVQTTEGCVDIISKPGLIKESPNPKWQNNSLRQCYKGNEIEISDFTKGTSTIHWGDGSKTGGKHKYKQSGDYNLLLIKTLNNGCSDTQQRLANILSHPRAIINRDTACANQDINFIDSSKAGTTSVLDPGQWQFQNEIPKTGSLVSFLKTDTGLYSLRLISTDTSNCSDTAIEIIRVYPTPIPTIIYGPSAISANYFYYNFECLTLNMSKYTWDLDIAGQQNGAKVQGLFPNENVYGIQLRIESKEGCLGVLDSQIRILGMQGFHLSNVFSPNGDGINDTWGIEGPEYIKEIDIRIFNERGKIMFKIRHPNERWDGSKAELDAYGYKGHVRDIYNRYKEVEGVIYLLR